MADHETPGDKLSRRLMSRSGLSRVTMDDGGAVHKGPLARRALRAVGARAMTMDNTIIVDEDFDPTDPEDQALYAHERVHELESGGDDHPDHLHDAEEVAARAVARMVLHRRAAGEGLGDIMRDVADPVSRAAASSSSSASAGSGSAAGAPGGSAGGYGALIAQGKTHQQIVEMLARKVLVALAEREHMVEIRSVPVKSI